MNSRPVQRLKGIYQGGASYFVNHRWNVTRYEHSAGVMLLIRKLGGSVEEQIAGLLHDVSHTAFSHVIDYVYDNEEEDFHELIYRNIIETSEIPGILEKYDLCYKTLLLDQTKWKLLEQPAPELCADRIDYTLRDLYQIGAISRREMNEFLHQLIVAGGKICLRHLEWAEWFTTAYYKEVIDFFMDPLNVYGYDYLVRGLKAALHNNIISINDLLKSDKEVMTLLQASTDKEVLSYITHIHPNVQVVEDPLNFHLHRKTKVRLIDPSVCSGSQTIRASRLSPKIQSMTLEAKRKAEAGTYVRILSN